jgi:cysteinyl-tRNA synthetase
VKARELARVERDWELADQLRQEIESLDWQIQDTSEGPKLTPQSVGTPD